ncbi:MAG TPA: ATP synthase F1 subunit gamma [Chitinophagales bacterium]|nr:ATP synthase F1 subunit gamma [Chitinophagales bacterium]HMU69488.1 ATP synthase F1 subunit gamma [Chitinophagales bacterium]HMX04537.1 ATP synthase F1 subunit gamma [Chitinophagales bacterium]HMZ90093.1 ATP synthase F1 subunit gamma [Chitinophagales bacterium]HNA57799.1 ATP synthase F1 subunit gamma [Chitinophagales bacterium]
MSGKLKEVRTRISSVMSTQQITKAMKMVSAAKLRRAQDAILQMRPYALKMGELLSNIAEAAGDDVKIDLAQKREVKNVLLVAITSDKGLCGAFNSNVVKALKRTIEERYAHLSNSNIHVMFIGKKAHDQMKRMPYQLHTEYINLFHQLSFEQVAAATDYIKQGFLKGEYDEVIVAYNKFKNAATQILETEQFLPIQKSAPVAGEKKSRTDYIYDPDKEQMILELVPRILNTTFFRYVLDSNASEHGARMTAMDKASDNANELLKELKISYNRARQAAITTELTEIVSGAAALQGS